jgi:PPOX class probable F420-dependent enzyme
MDLDEAREKLRQRPRAVLATLRKDGTPQLTPILATLDDDGRVIISSREPAYKVRNIRRTGKAWLLALNEGFFGDWVQVEGDAEIISLPEAMELLVDYYRRLSGEHPDWDDYRGAMQREQRCIIRLTISRAGPDVSG